MLWIAGLLIALVLLMLLSGGGSDSASREEKRIAEVLGAMAGVGRVEVMLYYGAEEADAFSRSAQKPTGAVVVAEGAQELGVRLSLIRAVRTLLGLPENAVDVFEMEDDG